MRSKAFIIIALIFGAITSGCSNSAGLKGSDLPDWAQPGKNQFFILSDDSDFDCPTRPNVVPDYDWMKNGKGYFTVCESFSNSKLLQISGTTSKSQQICVFPVSEGRLIREIAQDGGSDSLMHQCFDISKGSLVGNFTNVRSVFDSVFIVERAYAEQMYYCLDQGDYTLCPTNPGYYSYGSIK